VQSAFNLKKIMNRVKLLALLVIGGLFLVTGLSTDAFAVSTIDFDDKPDLTIITDDYKTDGVIFSSTYTLQILDDSGETPPGVPSFPNILVSNNILNNGDIIINVVDPVTFLPTDASSVSFTLYSVGNNKVTVIAKDSFGNPAPAQEFQHIDVGGVNCDYPSRPDCPGPITNGWGKTDYYTFSGPGPIRTVIIDSSRAVDGDGYGIDDVLVQFPSAQSVAGELLPLDTTALFVSGITSSAIWMIPTVVTASAVGYLAIRKII